MSESASRGLVVETVSLSEVPDLFTLDAVTPPLLWWRHGSGMVGLETVECLSFSGLARITNASAAWGEIVEAATITDQINLPGSGLTAWGTFSFSADSKSPSRLVIPRVTVGVRGEDAWLTRTRFEDEPEAPLTSSTARELVASYTRQTPIASVGVVSFASGELSDDAYQSAVLSAVSRIQAGAVEKVVLARDLVGAIPASFDAAPSIRKPSESYPDC